MKKKWLALCWITAGYILEHAGSNAGMDPEWNSRGSRMQPSKQLVRARSKLVATKRKLDPRLVRIQHRSNLHHKQKPENR